MQRRDESDKEKEGERREEIKCTQELPIQRKRERKLAKEEKRLRRYSQ